STHAMLHVPPPSSRWYMTCRPRCTICARCPSAWAIPERPPHRPSIGPAPVPATDAGSSPAPIVAPANGGPSPRPPCDRWKSLPPCALPADARSRLLPPGCESACDCRRQMSPCSCLLVLGIQDRSADTPEWGRIHAPMKSRRPAHCVRRATIRMKATSRRRAQRLWVNPSDATKPDTHSRLATEPDAGILVDAVDSDLEMQGRAGRPTCRTFKCDRRSARHDLPG